MIIVTGATGFIGSNRVADFNGAAICDLAAICDGAAIGDYR